MALRDYFQNPYDAQPNQYTNFGRYNLNKQKELDQFDEATKRFLIQRLIDENQGGYGGETNKRISGADMAKAASKGALTADATRVPVETYQPEEPKPQVQGSSLSNQVKAPVTAQNSDLGNFNYNTEQNILKGKQAFADKLKNTQIPVGQMVGGWYAAPGFGAQLAGALQQGLGHYLGMKNDEAMKGLDQQSIDAYAAAKSYDPSYAGPDISVPPTETAMGVANAADQMDVVNQSMNGPSPIPNDAIASALQGQAPIEPQFNPTVNTTGMAGPMQSPIGQALREPQFTAPAPLSPQQVAANQARQMQSLMASGELGRAEVANMLSGKDTKTGRFKYTQASEHGPAGVLDTVTGQFMPQGGQGGQGGVSTKNDKIIEGRVYRPDANGQYQEVPGIAPSKAEMKADKEMEQSQAMAQAGVEDIDVSIGELNGILSGKSSDGKVADDIASTQGIFGKIGEKVGGFLGTGSTRANTLNTLTNAMGTINKSAVDAAKAAGWTASAMNSDKDMQMLQGGTAVLDRLEKGQISPEEAQRTIERARDAAVRLRSRLSSKVAPSSSSGRTAPQGSVPKYGQTSGWKPQS